MQNGLEKRNANEPIKLRSYDLDKTLNGISKIRRSGHIIDHYWYEHICFENGNPDFLAMLLLADIFYWYTPTITKSEITGQVIGYEKKFKSDKLHRSIGSFSKQFGVSNRRISDALSRLVNLGLIERELRINDTADGRIVNALYLSPIVDAIAAITQTKKCASKETQKHTVEDLPSCNQLHDVTQNSVSSKYFAENNGFLTADNQKSTHNSSCFSPVLVSKIQSEGESCNQSHDRGLNTEEDYLINSMTSCNQLRDVMQTDVKGHAMNYAVNIEVKNTDRLHKQQAAEQKTVKSKNNIQEYENKHFAAVAINNNLIKKNSLQLEPLDSVIACELSDKQKAWIEQHIDKLPIDFKTDELSNEIAACLLDSSSFKKCGTDFCHKLNAIIKEIKKQTWTPPASCYKSIAEKIIYEKSEKDKALKMLTGRYESDLKYFHEQQKFINGGRLKNNEMLLMQHRMWEMLKTLKKSCEEKDSMVILSLLPSEPTTDLLAHENIRDALELGSKL